MSENFKMRRTDWNRLVWGESWSGDSSQFRFRHDEDIVSFLMEDEPEGLDALICEVETANATTFYDGVSPVVELTPAQLTVLRNLAGEKGLTELLENPKDEEVMTVSVRDWGTLVSLGDLLTRDMPANEPSRMDYNFVVAREKVPARTQSEQP